MANGIQKYEPQTALATQAIAPHSYDDVRALAAALAKSGMYTCRSPDEAFVRMVTGMEMGLSPMQAMRTITIIQGKPVLDAALIVALCMRHPDCTSWRVVETTDERCTMEIVHKRNGTSRLSYTIAQAQKAGLTNKDNWKHYPAAMLRARCASALARMALPEVSAGLYTPEELQRGEGAETVVDAAPAPAPSAPAASAADEFCARISVADTLDALTAIGLDVRAARLHRDDAGRVREAYTARQREIKAAAKGRASQPRPVEAPLPAVGNGLDDLGPEDPDGPNGVDAPQQPTRQPGDDSDEERGAA